MSLVSPIKDKAKIQRMWEVLKSRSDRDALLFLTGINTGFRISDILSLTVKDVMDNGVIRDRIYIKEKKIKKYANRVINQTFGKELQEYIELYGLEPADYLFFKHLDTTRPISRQYAWLRLKKYAHLAGISDFGTHSMRKSFGYYAYNETKNIALVMRLLNHRNPAVTLRYIGVDQDEQDKFLMEEWNIWNDE
jgi:integrase